MARSGLHRAHLHGRADGDPDRVVDGTAGAARRTGKPVSIAKPFEGSVVLPRAAGNARLLRSLAGRCGVPGSHHRRTDGNTLYRYQSEGKRLLHAEGPEVGNIDVSVWLSDPVDSSRHLGHVSSGS